MAQQEPDPQWADISRLDRLVHEPARLAVMTILSVVESADFLYLQRETGLTKGNLSAHLSKLEQAAYVKIDKRFRGKRPHTDCSLTPKGRQAFTRYVEQMRGALGGE